MIKQSDSSKKKWKPGIVDSQESFLIVASAAEVQSSITSRNQNYLAMGLTNQTYIIGVGDNTASVTYYLVVLDTIQYRAENLVKAIDIAFKMQFVLDSDYAQQCCLVWLLIQNYFYEIRLPSDKKSTAVTCLMSDLI